MEPLSQWHTEKFWSICVRPSLGPTSVLKSLTQNCGFADFINFIIVTTASFAYELRGRMDKDEWDFRLKYEKAYQLSREEGDENVTLLLYTCLS